MFSQFAEYPVKFMQRTYQTPNIMRLHCFIPRTIVFVIVFLYEISFKHSKYQRFIICKELLILLRKPITICNQRMNNAVIIRLVLYSPLNYFLLYLIIADMGLWNTLVVIISFRFIFILCCIFLSLM